MILCVAGLLEDRREGRKITHVAKEVFDIASQRGFSRLWKSFKTTGMSISVIGIVRRQLIWRESGTAYRPENIQEKDRYPTCEVSCWWAGMHDQWPHAPTCCGFAEWDRRTSQRYIDEVLLPHVRLFRGAVGDKFVFSGRQRNMSSNTRCSGLS
ncbi:hypothetical protein TNCV_1433401 [Trichonephila clavipes]|nr:hypothetical protein TNCV_1433401 [Trichonephila clavipes]